jgi:hypothetical protein
MVVVLAVTIVALCAAPVAADGSGEADETYHVLVGVVADSSFSVTVDGYVAEPNPVWSSPLGVLEFRIDESILPEGPHTVVLRRALGPAIASVEVTAVTDSTAVIEWVTDIPSDSSVEYGATDSYGQITDTDPALVTAHSVTLSGLEAGKTFHFRVRSRDVQGNLAISWDGTFTTWSIAPTGPPVIGSLETPVVGLSSVTVRWTTDRPAVSLVRYGTDGLPDTSTAVDTTLGTVHEFVLAPLAPRREYTFVAVSACGGDTTLAEPSTFTTAMPSGPELEGKGVGFTRCSVVGVGETSARLSWVTERPCTTWVEYGRSGSPWAICTAISLSDCAHEVTLSGLLPGTEYGYRVCALDAATGNPSEVSGNFVTAADSPHAPCGLSAASLWEGVELTWEANSEPDLIGYNVYRVTVDRIGPGSGSSRASRLNVGPVGEASFLDEWVTEGETYSYVVTAVDTAGLESDASGLAMVRYDPGIGALSLAIHPNPSFGSATLSFVAPLGSAVAARIYSVGGRLVRELTTVVNGSTDASLVWDGRDSRDRPVGRGVYLCEISCGGSATRGKLTVLR